LPGEYLAGKQYALDGGEYSRMRMTKIERILCQLAIKRHRPRVSSSRVFTGRRR
jgi:hypothetical protein